MDKLSVMRAFCRVVELKSFSKAADDLHVSAALLSRSIKQLEHSLGCVLLARTTRSMALTAHGALYYAEAQRLLAEFGAVEETLKRGVGAVEGRLRVNAPLSFGLVVLSPLLPKFRIAYPSLEIDLTLEDRTIDMIEGGFDVSIRVAAAMPDSNLIARIMGSMRQGLFAAPGYLSAEGRPQTPNDLKGHRLLSFSTAAHARKWVLLRSQEQTEFRFEPQLSVNNSLFLRDQLIAGEGIGALPSFISDPAVVAGALEPVLLAYRLPAPKIFAITAARLSSDAKTRAFLDFLQPALDDGESGANAPI
ncbi:MAG: LysR family transcriptional regulator [Neomegalonema sp.]|nr:LysR family transcriptional regulator [Neomegalonema sp.]